MRRHKYGAIPTMIDGIWFASQAEASRYAELRLLLSVRTSDGAIKDLVLQPRYPLVVAGRLVGTYVGDFEYTVVQTGERVTEDVKGVQTPVYRLKAKLFRALYGFDIRTTR